MNSRTRTRYTAAVTAVLLMLSATVGAVAFTGAAAANGTTTHLVHDAGLEASANGTAVWTAAGASLDVSAGSNTGDEARLVIPADDVGVATLGDLDSMAWQVIGGAGYAPHVDVVLGNGETLVFEYAKVDPADCDDVGDYPTGDYSTFADKGIVDAGAHAWLASGAPGPCGDPAFINGSLADWKAGTVDASVDANTSVVRFEVEVDNWIADPSSATIDGVTVNGAAYHDQVQDAVDVAADGDTVEVTDGTYTGQVTIATNNLTLTATTALAADLDGLGEDGSAITIAGGTSGVTIERLEIHNYTNPGSTGGVGSGVLAWNSTPVTDVTVRDNHFHDLGWNAVLVGNEGQALHSGWVVEDNAVERAAFYSIELTNTVDSVVRNNDIDGGTFDGETSDDGVLVQTQVHTGAGLTVSNVTVEGNTLNGTFERAGIELLAWDSTDSLTAGLQAVNVTGNAINGTDAAIFGFAVGANANLEGTASENTYGAGNLVVRSIAGGQARIDAPEPTSTTVVETVVETVTETVVEHEHHHHGGGGTQVVERTVTVQAPSPTPRVETVIEERTVVVEQPSPTPRVKTVIEERTVIHEITETPGQPGFGIAVAVVALLAAALLAVRRRD